MTVVGAWQIRRDPRRQMVVWGEGRSFDCGVGIQVDGRLGLARFRSRPSNGSPGVRLQNAEALLQRNTTSTNPHPGGATRAREEECCSGGLVAALGTTITWRLCLPYAPFPFPFSAADPLRPGTSTDVYK